MLRMEEHPAVGGDTAWVSEVHFVLNFYYYYGVPEEELNGR